MNHHSTKVVAVAVGALVIGFSAFAEEKPRQINGKALGLGNELIDIGAFEKASRKAIAHRKERRIAESQFIEMATEANTIVLDTRSAAKFALLHVKGAVHLNFSEITTDSLAKTIPTKDTRILIYCNNNFDNAPVAFRSKSPGMALNIPTFITLHAYGYENIYELGPLLDVKKTRISLVGMKLVTNHYLIPKLKTKN